MCLKQKHKLILRHEMMIQSAQLHLNGMNHTFGPQTKFLSSFAVQRDSTSTEKAAAQQGRASLESFTRSK